MINGQGPFRLVLDTGASHSAITALVALALGIPTDRSPPVILRGVTGFATVPTIRVDTLSVGDVAVDQAILPIVPDALGGAEGVLGSEGLLEKGIFIDFRHDRINIAYSKNERSGPGFVSVPFHSLRGTLVVVDAFVGSGALQGHHRYGWSGDDCESRPEGCAAALGAPVTHQNRHHHWRHQGC